MPLIDRDELLSKVQIFTNSVGDETFGVREIDVLNARTIDATKVVRCEECQYRETTNCITSEMMNNDSFCSCGQKK